MALLLSGVGLVCASIAPLRWLALPLTGLGLLAAIVGARTCRLRRDRSIAGAALIVSGVTLAVMLFWPNLLGMESIFARRPADEPAPDQWTMRPRSAVASEPETLPQPVAKDDWIDAEKFVVDHGVVRLRIDSVQLVAQPKGKEKKLQWTIAVELAHVGFRSEVVFSGWHGEFAPRLSDPAGRAIPFVTSTPNRPRSLRPLMPLRVELQFESPALLPEWLHLELPAGAYGCAGVARWRLSRSMFAGAGIQP